VFFDRGYLAIAFCPLDSNRCLRESNQSGFICRDFVYDHHASNFRGLHKITHPV
jgi:hypothetical protein